MVSDSLQTQVNPQTSVEKVFSLLGKQKEELGHFTLPLQLQESDGKVQVEVCRIDSGSWKFQRIFHLFLLLITLVALWRREEATVP